MKKITAVPVIVLCLALTPAAVFAGTECTNGTASNANCPSTFKASINVKVFCTSNTATYSASSGHLTGNKQYGVTSADTATYVKDKAAGSDAPVPSASDQTAFTGNGFSTL